tara:strand:+ start:718 stop:1599 length:882 start_codon:yes stop_codon:yes gene_type:complete
MPPITINKKFGHTVSALKGSNKIVASSKADFTTLKEDSYIVVDTDQEFYRITNKEKHLYVKDVDVLDTETIKINENIGTSLSVGDEIKFTHKEYKVSEVSILDGGSGYSENDELKPSSGVCKYNSLDEIDVPAIFLVKSVDENGTITSLEIHNNGSYSLAPDEEDDISSGSGSNARLSILSSLSDNRIVEERTISNIELKDSETLIRFNHGLPPRLISGELSVEKWSLSLDREYINDNKFNVSYSVLKDFTPHCKLPILRGDLNANYLLYNESLAILDNKIKELEDKIDSLGS